jgi:hypothetical protein
MRLAHLCIAWARDEHCGERKCRIPGDNCNMGDAQTQLNCP